MEYIIFNNQVRLATLNEIAQIVSDSAEQMQISNGFAYILPEEYIFGGDIYQLSKNFVDSPPVDVSDTIRLHALRVPMKACGKMSHDSIITADGLWAVEECVGREVTAEPWFTVGSGVRTTNSTYFGQYTPECNLQQLVNLGYTVVGPLVFNVDNVAALPDSELPYLIVGNLPFTNVLYYSDVLEVIQLQPDVVVRATPFKQSGKNYYPVTIDGVTYVVAVESQYGCNLQMLGRTVRRHRAPAHDARSRAELARHENPMFVHDARRDIRHDTRRLRLDDLNGSDELTAPRGNRCASNDTLRRKHIESTTVSTDERVMVDSVMSDEEVLSVLTGDTVDNTPVPSEFDSRLSVDRLKETLNRFGYKRRVKLLGICGDVKTYQYPGFIHTDVLQQIAPAADLRKIARNITSLHTMLTIDQCHEALHGNYDNAIIDISDPESTMHHLIYMGILPAAILTEFESRK